MDKYEAFKKYSGADITREEYEAGISFINGKMEGHPALIAAANERAWQVYAPILKKIAEKNAHIPTMLSKLSSSNPEAVLVFLREWVERQKPVSQLWEEVGIALDAGQEMRFTAISKRGEETVEVTYDNGNSMRCLFICDKFGI